MFGNMGCRDVFIEDDWLVVTGTMEFYMTFQSVGIMKFQIYVGKSIKIH
jgi:hypothetical protein